MNRRAAQSESDTSLGWLFRPYGLVGSPLATPVAGLFCAAFVLIFWLDAATPHQALMFFGLPPLLLGMWLLPGRHALLVAVAGAIAFIAATFTEQRLRPTEISICIVALVMAVGARWYAGEISDMMSLQSREGPTAGIDGAPQPQNGHLSAGLDLLTRRELEIARLASGGYTAREIATLLHISERTVENHLANVYAKLAISSRRALIKMAASFVNR